MQKPVIVGLATILVSQAALAKDDYAEGVKAYNDGNFGTSIQLLTSAIKGTQFKNQNAHYYLANAYLQLKNNSAALFEYRECLKLAPQSECGQHCLKAINHLTGVALPPQQVSLVQPTPPPTAKVLATTTAPAALKLPGLPPIPTFPKDDGPTLSDVLNWSQPEQVLYQLPAYGRKNDALFRLEKTQDALKRAQSLATSAIGSARQFGETDEAWKLRIANGRLQMAEILKPYELAIAAREKEVENMNQIYETCLSAGRR